MERNAEILIAALAIVVLLYAAYSYIRSSPADTAGMQRKTCMDICLGVSQRSESWYAGPCLAEAGQNGMAENWVCDVAHEPRQAVDNLKENQCATYGPGRRFVEVDTGCDFIRAV